MHVLSTFSSLPVAAHTPVGSEVYYGLTATPKSLSPWLFYDERGSQLFEEITDLPEYYPTRTERAILQKHADEILSAAAGDERMTIIELGAGTATKTGLLLRAAVRRQGSVTFHALDVSASALQEAEQQIKDQMHNVTFVPQVCNYTEELAPIECGSDRRLVLYIGSSIGNFEPPDALRILRDVRKGMGAGDRLLLGTDMVKASNVLQAAYDDASGVTAAFNKNVLERINRELGANFNLKLFRHRALWNAGLERMEMHLESLITQHVTVPALDLEVKFQRGETIHTENSYKFRDEKVIELLERADFHLSDHWSDEQEWFGVYLATAW